MTLPEERVQACANCGRAFSGRFCPDCGQEIRVIRRPMSEVAREFFGDFLAFDARLARTLTPLVLRPGRLTLEVFQGRRARYVPPLRLYVFSGFVYFTVMALTGGGPFAPSITSGEEGVLLSMRGITFRSDVSAGDGADDEDEAGRAEVVAGQFAERASAAARDQRAFGRAMIGSLSYAHLLLMPIFALLLKALYRRRYFMEHLIFSLHFHAFVLLPGALVVAAVALLPAEWSETGGRVAVLGWMLVIAVYLFLSLRRVYGDSRWRTAAKFAVLGFTYTMLASIVVLAVAVGTVWFF